MLIVTNLNLEGLMTLSDYGERREVNFLQYFRSLIQYIVLLLCWSHSTEILNWNITQNITEITFIIGVIHNFIQLLPNLVLKHRKHSFNYF